MSTDIEKPLPAAVSPAPVHIVLVETSHPGNIGAAARAMKTMGLSSLRLVKPARFPSAEATARASGADDVLARAALYDSLQDAIADCTLVLAASARQRSVPWPVLDPRAASREAVASAGPTALVFGREKWGLSNDELAFANYLIGIPANPDYSSLNLAMAVQVLAWELRMAMLDADVVRLPPQRDGVPPATVTQMAQFYQHLETVALENGFLDPANPRHLMRRFRRLFNRAQLDRNEVNIMRGLLSAAQGLKAHKIDSEPDETRTDVTRDAAKPR